MGAPGIAAVIIRREKDLVAHFQRAGAIDRVSAMTPSALVPSTIYGCDSISGRTPL